MRLSKLNRGEKTEKETDMDRRLDLAAGLLARIAVRLADEHYQPGDADVKTEGQQAS